MVATAATEATAAAIKAQAAVAVLGDIVARADTAGIVLIAAEVVQAVPVAVPVVAGFVMDVIPLHGIQHLTAAA